ncbi:ankyrin repeat-containing domain protein [Mycena galopus ATCC 62051]|nr:ankyrin repeat-containing domain protein [Mycena galopus ATCC 62051]
MAGLGDLPPELILHIVSFLTRDTMRIENRKRLAYESRKLELEFAPDLPSISALSHTNTIFHRTLNQCLYNVCASVESLGETSLLYAVEHDLRGAVDKLVAAGVSPDGEFDSAESWGPRNLLHIAASLGFCAMVLKLLGVCGEQMVHARQRDRVEGMTPLAWAARLTTSPLPRPPVGNVILMIRDRFRTQTQYLGNALMQSLMFGHRDICEYLVSEGADVNYTHHRFDRGTVLYHAVGSDDLVLVKLLLAAGADPNGNAGFGYFPLFSTSNLDIVQTLLVAGADIHATDATQSCNMLACVYNVNLDMFRFFLERGVDPNHQDRFGGTPLWHACCADDPEIAKSLVELLLEFGAVVTETGQRSPVDMAMERGKSFGEVVKIFEPFVKNPELRSKIAAWWEKEEEDGDERANSSEEEYF